MAKRILSLCMALMLAVTSLPLTAFAAQPGAEPVQTSSAAVQAAETSPAPEEAQPDAQADAPALTGALPAETALVPQELPVEEVQPDIQTSAPVQVTANNALGELLADDLTVPADGQDGAEDDKITALEVDKEAGQATVTYQAAVAADIVVAIYAEAEDGSEGQMVASGTVQAEATADAETAELAVTVPLTGDVPQYFIARAYLLQQGSHEPLCDAFTSELYTQDMQTLLDSSVEDYDEEKVLNLDENKDTNFVVFGEGVKYFKAAEHPDVQITENEDGTYTVQNADADFKALRQGDAFAYIVGDDMDTLLLIKIGSITAADDGTLIITSADKVTEGDFFDEIKIDLTKGGEWSVDDSNLPDGVTYVPENAVRTMANSDSFAKDYHPSFNFHTDLFKMTLTFDISVSGAYYLTKNRADASLILDLGVTVAGEVKPTVPIPIPLGDLSFKSGAFDIGFQPVLTISAGLGGTYTRSSVTRFGVLFSSAYGFKNVCKPPEPGDDDEDFTRSGDFFIGITVSFYAGYGGINPKYLLKISVDGTYGYGITMTESEHEEPDEETESIHVCNTCYEGELYRQLSATIKVSAFYKKEIGSDFPVGTPAKFVYQTFYWSNDHDTKEDHSKAWGYKSCPHIGYRVDVLTIGGATPYAGAHISVTDQNGNPVSDKNRFAKDLTTDETGYATFFLEPGTYILTAEYVKNKGEEPTTVTKTIEVTSKGKRNKVIFPIWAEIVDHGTLKSGSIEWIFYTDGKLAFTGEGEMDDFGYIWDTQNYTYIGNTPWLKYIEPNPSGGWYLPVTSVVTGEGITSIGQYAFSGCNHLTDVELPGVTLIGDYAFYNCPELVTFDFPQKLQRIGNYAFLESHISGAFLFNELTQIGDYAFKDCKNLMFLELPESLRNVGEGAFSGCTSIRSDKFVNGLLGDGVNLRSNVTYGEYAFMGCTAIPKVTIKEGITSINTGMFNGCSSLKKVVWPEDSLQKIGMGAFAGTALATIDDLPATVTSIDNNAFSNTLIDHITFDRYIHLGTGVFSGCKQLNSVTFTDDAYFGSSSFSDGTSGGGKIMSGALPGNTFEYCTALTHIDLPANLTGIGNFAFMESGLTSIDVTGTAVTCIGYGAFSSCQNLSTITLPDQVTEIGELAFAGTPITQLPNLNGVTEISGFMFEGCNSLQTVTIPRNITAIGQAAFASCKNLQEIDFGSGSQLKKIGDSAFSDCSELFRSWIDGKATYGVLTLPEGVQSVGASAFWHVLDNSRLPLWEVRFPSTLTEIGINAFHGRDEIEDVYFSGDQPKIVRDIYAASQDRVFYCKMPGITNVYIPQGNDTWVIDEIGPKMFYNYGCVLWQTWDPTAAAALAMAVPEDELTADGKLETAEPQSTPEAAQTPESAATPETAPASEPTADPAETEVPEATAEPTPTEAPDPAPDETETPAPTEAPEVTAEPEPAPDGETVEETAPAESPAPAAEGDAATEADAGDPADNIRRKGPAAFAAAGSVGVVPLMQFPGQIGNAGAAQQTASFTGLTPGKPYAFVLVRSAEAEALLAAENLLYIGQNNADENGALTFTYRPRLVVEGAVALAFGADGSDISSWTVTIPQDNYSYTGKPIEPPVTVRRGDQTLELTKDYTVEYKDNINVGTASVTVTGQGTYTGSKVLTFTITGPSAEGFTVSAIKPVTYNGEAYKPAVTVKYNKITLKNGTDYTLEYGENINAGTGTVTVLGIGGYSGSKTVEFTINPMSIGGLVLPKLDPITYTGQEQVLPLEDADGSGSLQPTIKTKADPQMPLVKNRDYTVTYKNNLKAGTATVTFTGTGNYKGSVNKTFKIAAKPLTDEDISKTLSELTKIAAEEIATEGSTPYTAKAITPQETLTLSKDTAGTDTDVPLVRNTDYTVSYANNTNVAKASDTKAPTVTVTGKGNYSGKLTLKFTISKRDLSTAGDALSIVQKALTYNGGPQTPTFTVKYNGKTLALNKDYEIIQKGNIATTQTEAGTYDVTIKALAGSASYAGQVDTEFTIKPYDIAKASIPAIKEKADLSLTYDGEAKKPVFSGGNTQGEITINPGKGKRSLTEGVDYEIDYMNNVNAGTATVIFEGIGNYTGMASKTFKIAPLKLTAENIVFDCPGVTYTGKAIKLESVLTEAQLTGLVTMKGTALEYGTDYTLTGYSKNTNVTSDTSKATVTVTGKGNYTGSVTKNSFTIQSLDLANENVTIEAADMVYNASKATTPKVTVTYTLKDKDGNDIKYTIPTSAYTVHYGFDKNTGTENKNAYKDAIGTQRETIVLTAKGANTTVSNGDGNIGGENFVYADPFRIGYDLKSVTMTGQITAAVYGTLQSEAITTENVAQLDKVKGTPVTLTVGGKNGNSFTLQDLLSKKAVTAELSNIGKKGTAKLTVTAVKGEAADLGDGIFLIGSISKNISITAKPMSDESIHVSVDGGPFTFTGQKWEPAVTVTDDGKPLELKTDYTVSYKNNINAGVNTATVTITGKGNYSKSTTVKFTIDSLDLKSKDVQITVADMAQNAKNNYKSSAPKVTVTCKGKDKDGSDVEYTVPASAYKVLYNDRDKWAAGIENTGAVTVTKADKNDNTSGEVSLPVWIGINMTGVKVGALGKQTWDPLPANGVELPEENFDGLVTYTQNKVTHVLEKGEKKAEDDTEAEEQNKDYYVSYTKNKAKGTATVTFTSLHNKNREDELFFVGSISKTFAIQARPLDLDDLNIDLLVNDKSILEGDNEGDKPGTPYTGKVITPTVAVSFKNEDGDPIPLKEKTDYTVSFKNNTKVGTATVTITGKGSYSGKVETTFRIKRPNET